MLLRTVAPLILLAASQAACSAAKPHGLPDEDFTMPRDPGDNVTDAADSEPDSTPQERTARRSRRGIAPTSSALASASPAVDPAPTGTTAPVAEVVVESHDRDIALVLADGSLSPSVIRAMATTAEPGHRAELLRALGFAATDVDGVANQLGAPAEITEANLDRDPEREWVVHIASGEHGLTPETHFIAWLKHEGAGLKPLATRVEHVANACCDGPKANGELRLEVMNVHSNTVADTVIWRDQTEPHSTMTDASVAKSSVDVVSLEHKRPEGIFHWEATGKPAGARDGVIIGDADDAPRPIVVFSSAGKPKKTFKFDAKAFAYK